MRNAVDEEDSEDDEVISLVFSLLEETNFSLCSLLEEKRHAESNVATSNSDILNIFFIMFTPFFKFIYLAFISIIFSVASRERLERPTYSFEDCCSIQLNYRDTYLD